MKNKIIDLLKKYREIISYVFFGGCTTVVSLGTYYLFLWGFNIDYRISKVFSLVISIAFAFVVNKIFVFKSKTKGLAALLYQIGSFCGVRALSGVIEWLMLTFSVEILKCNESIANLIVSVIIVLINYFASKLFIFRKTSDNK